MHPLQAQQTKPDTTLMAESAAIREDIERIGHRINALYESLFGPEPTDACIDVPPEPSPSVARNLAKSRDGIEHICRRLARIEGKI